MKNNEILVGVAAPAYEAPSMSLVEVTVESGFVGSDFESNQTPSYEEEDIWGQN